MKTLKHFALAALVVAGLLLPAVTRPRPASADFCGVFLAIVSFGQDCAPSGVVHPTACSVSGPVVSATADGNHNSYKYDLICDQGTPTIHVTGGYSLDKQAADESLTADPDSISASWNCDHDPWIAPTAPVCSRVTPSRVPLPNVAFSTAGYPYVFYVPDADLSKRSEPFSTVYLDDQSRQGLFFAQLQYTANQAAIAAKQAAIHAALFTTTTTLAGSGASAASVFRTTPGVGEVTSATTTQCAICSVLGSTPAPAPAPTLPDFKIMAVRAEVPKPDPADKNKELLTNGMTASYDVVVANLGARIPAQVNITDPNPPQPKVQVSIQVTGALQYAGMTQTPAGWDCSGKGPILCVGPLGGYGDAIQDTVVTFRLQILGARVGSGPYAGVSAISAAADPNGLIKESDVTNNALTLAITVK